MIIGLLLFAGLIHIAGVNYEKGDVGECWVLLVVAMCVAARIVHMGGSL
jgi:hypothetical protein